MHNQNYFKKLWHPSETHMLPKAWIEAGYELIHLDMQSEMVTLRKTH